MKPCKEHYHSDKTTTYVLCCFWQNLKCLIMPINTQGPDEGIKAWCLREEEKTLSEPSPQLMSQKKSPSSPPSQKPLNWMSLPSTSCISLYLSSWLPLTLSVFFLCLLPLSWLFALHLDLCLTLFNPVGNKQESFGLKVCAGSEHTTRTRLFQ